MSNIMTNRQRAVTALTGGIPDRIPTFELEFQLSEEFFGKGYLKEEDLEYCSAAEAEKKIYENAEFMVEMFSKLEHSIIPMQGARQLETAKAIKKIAGDEFLLTAHGDGTFSIPDGNEMYSFAYRIADEPEEVLKDAESMANAAIERNKRAMDAGIDSFILCADYCYNSGPFISPEMFRMYITPFLKKIIKAIKDDGGYAIKHTDGNIMPILDQLAECEPHAIHSLDPMAGIDIKEVKRLIGDEIALCGNVNCALMQNGTEEEVIASAEYCLEHGKPGGGYIFCTSNVPFRGLPLERYLLALDVWKKRRDY